MFTITITFWYKIIFKNIVKFLCKLQKLVNFNKYLET